MEVSLQNASQRTQITGLGLEVGLRENISDAGIRLEQKDVEGIRSVLLHEAELARKGQLLIELDSSSVESLEVCRISVFRSGKSCYETRVRDPQPVFLILGPVSWSANVERYQRKTADVRVVELFHKLAVQSGGCMNETAAEAAVKLQLQGLPKITIGATLPISIEELGLE